MEERERERKERKEGREKKRERKNSIKEKNRKKVFLPNIELIMKRSSAHDTDKVAQKHRENKQLMAFNNLFICWKS